MAARSLASLTLSFGLVNIPVQLYSATESSGTVRFNFLTQEGSRVKQQYTSEKTGKVVPRSEMVKGYEFEKDQFVIFTPDELKALDEAASHVIDIVAFVPIETVDPIYYDRAYFLAPDKRGGKPYALLKAAMQESGKCALARFVSHGKQYVAQIRPGEDGLILQQLLYADEVRSQKDLGIEDTAVSKAELQLALQLIDQISADTYDPTEFKDDEKQRILDAIDRKIAGKQVVEAVRADEPAGTGGQIIDLVDALKKSLSGSKAKKPAAAPAKSLKSAQIIPADVLKDRKPPRRTAKPEVVASTASKPRVRK